MKYRILRSKTRFMNSINPESTRVFVLCTNSSGQQLYFILISCTEADFRFVVLDTLLVLCSYLVCLLDVAVVSYRQG